MIEKLTKKQKQWLIEKIVDQFTSHEVFQDQPHYVTLYMAIASKVINECTEKEFPEQVINLHDYSQTIVGCIKLSYYKEYNIQQIELRMQTPGKTDSYTTMFIEEFKQFTEGCNKIAGWINEQETK